MCLIGSFVILIRRKHKAETPRPTTRAPHNSLTMTVKKLLPLVSRYNSLMKMKTATPVPSLNRDSPSITAVTFFESPNLFKIPVAAIGSVGETMVPRRKQSVNPIFNPSKEVIPQNKSP